MRWWEKEMKQDHHSSFLPWPDPLFLDSFKALKQVCKLKHKFKFIKTAKIYMTRFN